MKKTILIPIAASIMCLGALALVPSKAMKVSADGTTYYRYFLLDENSEYGLCEGAYAQGTTSVKTYANLNNPIWVEPVQGGFRISIVSGGTRYYAKRKSNTTTAFDMNAANALTWTMTPDSVTGKVSIGADGRYLGFKNDTPSFVLTESRDADKDYNLTLLPVDEHSTVQALVTAIRNIDCSEHNPDKENDWDPVGTAVAAITDTPILNYLKVAPADKDAADTTLEWAMAKYDYVCGKYRESKGFTDHLQRNPSYPTDGVGAYTTNIETNNHLTVVVTTVALITIASVTSLLFFKRKSK